jgi:hypothetical protein
VAVCFSVRVVHIHHEHLLVSRYVHLQVTFQVTSAMQRHGLISPLHLTVLPARTMLGRLPPAVRSHAPSVFHTTGCAQLIPAAFFSTSSLSLGATAPPTVPSVAVTSVPSISVAPDLTASPVEIAIAKVEREIDAAALQLQTPGLPKDDVVYFRPEIVALRKENADLRHQMMHVTNAKPHNHQST